MPSIPICNVIIPTFSFDTVWGIYKAIAPRAIRPMTAPAAVALGAPPVAAEALALVLAYVAPEAEEADPEVVLAAAVERLESSELADAEAELATLLADEMALLTLVPVAVPLTTESVAVAAVEAEDTALLMAADAVAAPRVISLVLDATVLVLSMTK